MSSPLNVQGLVSALTAVLGALVVLLKRQRRRPRRRPPAAGHCQADLPKRIK